MKIGLNATCFNSRPSGAKQRFVGIYGELINRLPNTEFVIYEPVDCRVADWFGGAINVSARSTPLPSVGRTRRYIGGLTYWRSVLKKETFDIFEGFNLPHFKIINAPSILTIHDIRRMYPEYGILERTVFRLALQGSLKEVNHLITVSESMKKEILAYYADISISVIYNGLDVCEFNRLSKLDLLSIRQRFGLPEEFILAVGHFEKRKNYLRLVDAVALLRDRGHSCYLVIVGNDSGLRRAVETQVILADLSSNVKILSGLSDLEVRCLYKLSSLFVFPSSYEGFGIPILEAMAAGCPIVLSDIPVFREITQSRCVYFPHHDVEAMALAIDSVLSSSSERSRLAEYGQERVQFFSFKNLAAQLESLYRSVIADR